MARSAIYTRPWVYPRQRDALFHDDRYGVVEASTKSGKTVGCIVWITERALEGRSGCNYWWVAPIKPQAAIAYRRLKRYLPRGVYKPNETERTITLGNGAVIWFKGSDDPDSLYGEDVYAAVLDEATRMKEEAWTAIRSTLTATGGPVRIIGNVKGRRNWAYRLARRAEAGEPNMRYAKLTVHDAVRAGIFPQAEADDAQRVLPPHVYRELYLAEPSDDEGNPFGGADSIGRCVRKLSGKAPVAHGVDLAKSIDWTVNIGLDDAGAVCLLDRFQLPWRETLDRIAGRLRARALIDSTGVGDPIVEELQHRPGLRVEGFKFSSSSKQQLMEGLALAIRKRGVSFPQGPITAELEAFEYAYTRTGVRYQAPEGVHDDCVTALALAVECRGQRRISEGPLAV